MSFEGVVIRYPTPAADLGARMTDALVTLDAAALRNARARMDVYAVALSVNDILSLRGAAFRKLDAAARRESADRRKAS